MVQVTPPQQMLSMLAEHGYTLDKLQALDPAGLRRASSTAELTEQQHDSLVKIISGQAGHVPSPALNTSGAFLYYWNTNSKRL